MSDDSRTGWTTDSDEGGEWHDFQVSSAKGEESEAGVCKIMDNNVDASKKLETEFPDLYAMTVSANTPDHCHILRLLITT